MAATSTGPPACWHGAPSYLPRAAARSILQRSAPFPLFVVVREPWSPLASGLLSGKYRRGQPAPAGTRLDAWKERSKLLTEGRNWDIVEAVADAAQQLGATSSQVAFAWLLGRDTVSSVIIGVRTLEQLEDNLKSVDLPLPQEVATRLSEVSAPQLRYPYDFMKRNDGAW